MRLFVMVNNPILWYSIFLLASLLQVRKDNKTNTLAAYFFGT